MSQALWLAQLISDLTSASPATVGDARSRVKQLLLRAATQRNVSSSVDRSLKKLEDAIKAIKVGEIIDEMISEIGTGGLTRVADLYDTSAARVSGWRNATPDGINTRTILMAAWLQHDRSVAENLPIYKGGLIAAPKTGATTTNPSAKTSLADSPNDPTGAKELVPIRYAMNFDEEEALLRIGSNAVLPRYPLWGIVFMGEAPGVPEMISGEPFSGRSGELLIDTIEERFDQLQGSIFAGDYSLTNVFLTPPPKGRVASFFGPAKSDDTIHELPAFPYGHLLKRHLPSLCLNARYLVEAKPKVIVALGAVAAWALIGRSDVSKMKGKFHEIDYGPFQSKVMVTYHPAYVIRDPNKRLKEFIRDIEAAIDESRS